MSGELLERPPRTIMEVYKMLPEGTLAELIDNVIYMSPSPVRKHREIIGKLFTEMFRFVELEDTGKVFVAPFDVYLDEHSNAVQPDIIFVTKERMSIVQDHIHGVPDLLIELLSPGNRTHDIMTKKGLYQKYGVREYWIVDPDTKESVGYTMEKNEYKEIFRGSGAVDSLLLAHTFNF